jgi:hypothetical protein
VQPLAGDRGLLWESKDCVPSSPHHHHHCYVQGVLWH